MTSRESTLGLDGHVSRLERRTHPTPTHSLRHYTLSSGYAHPRWASPIMEAPQQGHARVSALSRPFHRVHELSRDPCFLMMVGTWQSSLRPLFTLDMLDRSPKQRETLGRCRHQPPFTLYHIPIRSRLRCIGRFAPKLQTALDRSPSDEGSKPNARYLRQECLEPLTRPPSPRACRNANGAWGRRI
jgi:hypothetical protein